MKVCIIGPNLLDQSQGSFHVHKYGCADTAKSQYRFHRDDANRSYDYATQTELILDTYSDIIAEGNYGDDENAAAQLADEFKFFPCAPLPYNHEPEA